MIFKIIATASKAVTIDKISSDKLQPFLKALARVAGNIMINKRPQAIAHVEYKDDTPGAKQGTPVTKIDREVEALVSKQLTRYLPGSIVIGEETFGSEIVEQAQRTRFVWVLDPIDGTRPYITPGETGYGIGIVLLEWGEPVCSSMYAPELDLDGSGTSLFEAHREKEEACLNGQPISIKDKATSQPLLSIYQSPRAKKPLPFAKLLKVFFPNHADISKKPPPTVFHIPCMILKKGLHPLADIAVFTPPPVWDVLQASFWAIKAGWTVTFDTGAPLFPIQWREMPGKRILRPLALGLPSAHKRLLAAIKSMVNE